MEHPHCVSPYRLICPSDTHKKYHRTCIHQFTTARLLTSPNLAAGSSSGHGHAITALVQSPAIDVIGIGFTSGEISVYDIRADEKLMRMFMEGGGIRALGFRSGLFSFLIFDSNLLNLFPVRRTSSARLCLFCRTYRTMGFE